MLLPARIRKLQLLDAPLLMLAIRVINGLLVRRWSKVQRREVAERELLKSIAETTDKDALTKLWNHAAGNGLARSESVSEAFRQRGEALKA